MSFDGRNLLIEQSAFLANTAPAGSGGGVGIHASVPGAVDIVNTTFFGNQAGLAGGAVGIGGPTNVRLTHLTVVGNTADGEVVPSVRVGGIGGDTSETSIGGSIVAGNQNADCYGATPELRPTTVGGNVGPFGAGDATCGFNAGISDRNVADPLLVATPVAGANGVPVMKPLAGSLAIGAATATCPWDDAAGEARVITRCSAGAAEPVAGTPGGEPDPGEGEQPGGDGDQPGNPGSPGNPGTPGTPRTPGGPVIADKTAPTLKLPTALSVDKKRKRALLKIACPAAETSCAIDARLERKRKVKGKTRTEGLAVGKATIAGGKSANVRVSLKKRGRSALAGRKTLKVTLRIKVWDAARNARTQTRTVKLRLAK